MVRKKMRRGGHLFAAIAWSPLAFALAASAHAQEATGSSAQASAQQSNGAPMAMPMKSMPMAQAQAAGDDRQILLDRIDQLEQRLAAMEARLANGAPASPPAQASAAPSTPGDANPAPTAAASSNAELEARVASLEENVVLSEPKATVKKIEVWVDANGNQYDHPVEGAKPQISYQRETTSRRQSIGEEIEAALADAEEHSVRIGVSSTLTLQNAQQLQGPKSPAAGHSYALASADITFTAGLAQNTMFFADVVGLSGNPPDQEIGGLTLLNSYTARLSRQNELNLREAWIKTQLFNQRVDVTAGRVDLTNYFDNNVGANDETTQFLSDALVNNPALGLSSNGAGIVVAYQPYSSLSVRVGAQQSNPLATSLSESIYSLAEVSYLARPFGLPEGNYRVWFRTDNTAGSRRDAWGVSLDQKLTPNILLFGRYGQGDVGPDRVKFASAGFQFANTIVLSPLDVWGLGYAHTEIGLAKEDLGEIYYNLHLTERLRLSAHVQYVRENDNVTVRSFLLPGLRLQAQF
jgi:hypothetical protein